MEEPNGGSWTVEVPPERGAAASLDPASGGKLERLGKK